jgi:hypothetical protein
MQYPRSILSCTTLFSFEGLQTFKRVVIYVAIYEAIISVKDKAKDRAVKRARVRSNPNWDSAGKPVRT